MQHQVQKAFGKAGDMVNVKSGKDWIPKWEAKVVMATVTKAKTLKSNKALTLNIAGGKPCDAAMVRQPTLARAITRQRWQVRNLECVSNSLRLMSSRKDIRPPSQKTSKSTKENRESKDGKGGKDTQDDKGGKDHHSSLPSRSRPRQAEFITPAHYSFPYSV